MQERQWFMIMKHRHLIDLESYPQEDLERILSRALRIRENPDAWAHACEGKILATLFYEPSTRTQMSFQTAMLRLGGRVIGFDNPLNSSVAKGESLKDTLTVISGYADIIALRNPLEGAAYAAGMFADCPVINAGDGGHLHPTQTLTDLTALRVLKGGLHGLAIGLCGDLKHGRTVHSLIKTMCRYGASFVLVSTKELTLPPYLKDWMDAAGCKYRECFRLEDAIGEIDVLYMTRIQRERFESEEQYERERAVYCLDAAKMKLARPDMVVLHPLPRVDEIAVEVDSDPRAKYFEQTMCGVWARMSLIVDMLENDEAQHTPAPPAVPHAPACTNARCITNHEPYLPRGFAQLGDMLVCSYCEERILRR